MNLKKCLSKDTICIRLKSDNKEEVLVELVDLLVAGAQVKNRDGVLKAIREREQKMSTGMQNGIAIPHAKVDSLDQLVAAIGLKPEGIEFDSIDGKPCSIFIITLSPSKRAGPHIQFLAEISRVLTDDSIRAKLLESSSADEVIDILTSH